jgi:hypothetical protein
MSLLRLGAIDREDDLSDRFVLSAESFGVLLRRREHHLVTLNLMLRILPLRFRQMSCRWATLVWISLPKRMSERDSFCARKVVRDISGR